MTNADKIRSLNDEEIESFLRNIKQRTKIALTVYSHSLPTSSRVPQLSVPPSL